MTLNVLVLESDRGAADRAIADLTAAGHRVARCHDGEAPAFPCAALNGGCPLRNETIDVALAVRRHPRLQPAPQEDGVTCALRTHVPLVVAGATALNPFDDYAAAVVRDPDDIVAACERAARQPLPAHTRAAVEAFGRVMQTHDVSDVTVRVEVRRVHGSLLISVTNAGAVPHAIRSIAAVRMMAAVREIDHDSHGIDVTFDE
jgi:hypothetical protein